MIIDNLSKRPEPTIPKDTKDPPRFAQPLETTKDAFTIELRKFFDRQYQNSSKIEEIPNIQKYELSFNSKETSLETAVKLIQKHPSSIENLPLIAVLGATGRNLSMGIGGQYVAAVAARPTVTGIVSEPFALSDGAILRYKTKDPQGNIRTSTTLFRQSRFANIAQATADEVVREINFQALFTTGGSSGGKITLGYGGPATNGTTGDIEIIGGTAASALGFVPGQKAEYASTMPFNRYLQSTSIEIAIEIATEEENTRTELTDLVWSFFTFYMDDRDYTFLGRSIFDSNISNETYQVIIKPDPAIAGEQEVPRPNDQIDKVYVNRISVPVTTIQYIDRAVVMSGTTTPLYFDASMVQLDETIPPKS